MARQNFQQNEPGGVRRGSQKNSASQSPRNQKFKKTVIAGLLILIMLGPIFTPLAEGFNFPERYDLVAILVEQGLYQNAQDFTGLSDMAAGPIQSTTIKARVDRYAIDLQNALPNTRALIIQTDRYENTNNIASVLERLYFEGDPKEPGRVAYLKGVVIIGEVPLPVVNKKGTRFISLYPYTDFERKVYVWNENTRDFELGEDFGADSSQIPQPEIWHGVITPPASTATDDGKQLIASYLDKNHLYHVGDPAYTNFDKRVFFQDFINEKKNLNPIAYKNYLNFLAHQGDIAYMRYTKELLADLTGPIEAELAQDQAETEGFKSELADYGIDMGGPTPTQFDLPEDAQNTLDEAWAEADITSDDVPADEMPDIMTKIGKMSDNLMSRFYQVFTKYPNLINDFMKYTGRYSTNGIQAVDSAVNLITAKDNFTLGYLKAVNTMVENRIDEIVETQLQMPVPIIKESKIELVSAMHKPGEAGGDPYEVDLNGADVVNTPAFFTNFGADLEFVGNILNPPRSAPLVYGTQMFDITSVSQCSLYRGSKGIKPYSKLVEANHAYNLNSALEVTSNIDSVPEIYRDYCTGIGQFFNPGGDDEGPSDKNCMGFFMHAGCYFVPKSSLYDVDDPDKSWCFPENAFLPIFDIEGTVERDSAPLGADDFRSCFSFNEKEKWRTHSDVVRYYLFGVDDYDHQFKYRLRHSRPDELIDSSEHPDDIVIFSNDSYTLTLGTVLRAINLDLSPANWQQKLSEFLGKFRLLDTITTSITHPKLASASVKIINTVDHMVSSVFYHKEPTNETLNAQARNMVTKQLPVDNPRYLTFQDKTGSVRRINYPDLFAAGSPEEYLAQLTEIENQINAAPIQHGVSSESRTCSSCLTSLLSDLLEIYENPASSDTLLTRANRLKVLDSLNWKNMDMDSKHKYINEFYLDSSKNAYIGESRGGYEMAYYNGEGSAQAYNFSLNADIPEETESLIVSAPAAEDDYKDDPNNPFDSPPSRSPSEGYDLFTWSPPMTSPWYDRMEEWKAGLSEALRPFEFGDSESDFYGQMESKNAESLADIKKQSGEIEADPQNADKVKFSKIESMELSADCLTVAADKQISVNILLKDKNGKMVEDEFAEATLTLTGSGRFGDQIKDLDKKEEGMQILFISGKQQVQIVTGEPGAINLNVQIKDGPVGGLDLNSVQGAHIALQSEVTAIPADGAAQVSIDIFASDENEQLIASANGIVNIALSDPTMGVLSSEKVRLIAGRGNFKFTSGIKKGNVFINAASSVLDPGQFEIKLLPGAPSYIRAAADSEILPADASGQVKIEASLFDAHGNMVDTDSSTQINFRLTDATANFGVLSAASGRAEKGVASVIIRPAEQTGPVTVIAEGSHLSSGSITIKSVKSFGAAEVLNMNTDALTVALLGIPAGDIKTRNYLGGLFLQSGRVEAATSLTTQPKTYKKLFEFTNTGGLVLPDPTRISAGFLPANNLAMVLRDNKLRQDIAQVSIFAIKEGQFDVTSEGNPEKLADGIYMRNLGVSPNYVVDLKKGALRVTKEGSEKMEIQTNGFLRIFDNDFIVRPRAGNFLILDVMDKETVVAEILVVQRFNQDVRVIPAGTEAGALDAPGVYANVFKSPPNIIFAPSHSGNSSADPRGIAFFDKDEIVIGSEAVGFGFESLEDSPDKFGIGFTEGNKFGLLFAAGETFGEANRFYASDAGIVLGDPLVRINNRSSNSENFSMDIGKMLYAGGATVQGLLGLDYNTDGFEDLLIISEDGKVRLLQNNGGYEHLKDQGFILNIKNGIQDYAKIDFNNDRQADLVIAGKDSCRQGETCIDVYENQGGAFVRHNLKFGQVDNIVTVRAYDLNNDDFTDLVFADSAGDIKVIYNREGVFDEIAYLIGNVGLQIDPAKNLIGSVLVNYDGLTSNNLEDPILSQKYQTLSVGSGSDISQVDFIYADADSAFSSSTKLAEDLNGDILRGGDRVRYTITLQNSSAAAKNDVAVSDVVPDKFEPDEESVECVDCGTQKMEMETLSGDATRPYLFKNIRIPAHAIRRIVYEGIFKGDSSSSEKVNIGFSNHFTDSNRTLQASLSRDDYPDLSVSKVGNPTGQVRYFYTTELGRSNGILSWSSALSSLPVPLNATALKEKTGLDMPRQEDFDNFPVHCDFYNEAIRRYIDEIKNSAAECEAAGGIVRDPAGPPPSAQTKLDQMKGTDSDGDGLQDTIDDVNGALDNIAVNTASAVSALTCNVGCINLPLNAAFLAPGFWSILGTPGAYDIGTPVFGWGAPTLIPSYPPMPALSTLGGRFYISPTLTGGVGFAICTGPYGIPKNCYSFGLNPLDLITPGMCDSINNGIGNAMANANDVISDANEGMTLTIPVNGAPPSGANRRGEGSGFVSYSLGSYEAPVSRSRNIRIPGFPRVVTDWWSAQLEEITDKALNIPDIYLIYPSLSSVGAAALPSEDFSRTGDTLTNILSYVNSIPLIDIETQEVLFKIPMITRKEVEKAKADARQWLEDEKAELDKWMNLMGCFGLPQAVGGLVGQPTVPTSQIGNLELCRFVEVGMQNLISSVVANMKALDEWILFPKKILQFRAIESYYLGQIIDYLDTVINYTGGWVKRNTAIVKQWRRAVRQIKDVIQNWRGLIDIMIDYNESCDKCKTERYGLKELILRVFMAIPTPPVIPIPKLPDIIVDVSKVQAGLRIEWPDVKFKPEPFTIPKLPRFGLGVNLTIPMFRLMVPPIPVIPSPPDLPRLPALPPLNLPSLPNFPPPPTMPGLPGQIRVLISIFKKIVKILCLIRQGFIPTDESLLKTRIEEITARGLTPILPVDLLFTIQSPTISVTYWDQIIITAFTNLRLDTSFIQDAVESAAVRANSFSISLVKDVNTFTNTLSKQLEKYTNPQLNISKDGVKLNYKQASPRKAVLGLSDEKSALVKEFTKLIGFDATNLVDLGLQMRAVLGSLNQTKIEREKMNAAIPNNLTIVMDTERFQSDKIAQNSDPENLVLPLQKRLKEYRDNLAAHTASTQDLFDHRELASDLQDFGNYISSQKSAFKSSSLKRYVASTQPALNSGEYSSDPIKVGQFLAYGLTPPPQIEIPDAGADGASTSEPVIGKIQDIGIFYINNEGESRRLTSYTLEAGQPSRLADIDLDNDGDKDKIYSYGANVYAKRNERLPDEDDLVIFRLEDIEFWTIYELLPRGRSVSAPKVLSETSSEVGLTFSGSYLKDIAGYEIIARSSPFFFEQLGMNSTWRSHLLADSGQPQAALSQNLDLIEPEGELAINDSPAASMTIKIGDNVTTHDNSLVSIKASDGTLIRVSDNSAFTLTQGGNFSLERGEIEIELPVAGSLLFPLGTNFIAKEGQIRLRLFEGSDVTVLPGAPFTLPQFLPVIGSVTSVSGRAFFTGQNREFIRPGSGKVHMLPGDSLHPLEVVDIIWNVGEPGERELTLSKNIIIPVPDSFSDGIDIESDSGIAEIIRAEKTQQPVSAGMALKFGDSIRVETGSVNINYANGGNTTLRFNETYVLNKAENFEKPTAKIEVPPAFYFAKIYAFDKDGNRTNASEKLLLSPQVCGDASLPFASTGSAEYDVAIGKTLQLDATRSFDSFGKVISYWLDTDTSVDNNDRDLWKDNDPASDTDGDGNKENDADSPYFTVGPYSKVGKINMRLGVRDEALNQGYQDIVVNVITPTIVLEAPPLRSNIIKGFIKPPEANVPITFARLRAGEHSLGWEIIKTPTADSGGQYFTDAQGKFIVEDADMRDRLIVRNNEGQIIAEINTATGRITILDERYETRLMSFESGLPLRIGIYLKTELSQDNPITFVYFVPDVNTDTVIDGAEVIYNESSVSNMSGVHIKPLPLAAEKGIMFSVLPGNDPQIPGATIAKLGTERLVAVDVNGDVIISNPSITLREKAADTAVQNQPIIFEMLFQNQVIAEIYIAAKISIDDKIKIVDTPEPAIRPIPVAQVSSMPFTDVASRDPFANVLSELYKRGIIAGYPSNVKGELLFKPENKINRAEFTQITLNMLCIIPRPEAHKLPSPFYDVLNTKLWFYPVLKEGNIRAFIKGYVGDMRTDPVTGVSQTPFRPDNNITRAEAATVILAALQEQGVIDLSTANLAPDPGGVWYQKYVLTAQNLKPYIINKNDVPVLPFLITQSEARNPERQISRKEFAIMAERVLLFHDCRDINRDGLPDNLGLANDDPDKDGCNNSVEYKAGSDLNNPDTDNGGVNDCEEIRRGTDPVNNEYDDRPQLPLELLENRQGMFVLRPSCGNMCPCRASIESGADLQPEDTIFAAITGANGLPIYARSNEEKF